MMSTAHATSPGRRWPLLAGGLVMAWLAACGDEANLADGATTGPNPQIPAPTTSLIPTVNIAPAKGWAEGEKPVPAAGLTVTALAEKLDHPRWLHVLPNGDVLVAESRAPPRPKEDKGIKGWIMKTVQGWAGAGGASANRITLLRDADADGTAEIRSVFLAGLNSPFGMALIGSSFYVANTDAILRFPYVEGATEITAEGEKVADLPAGPLNHHWTKNIIAAPDGSKLYATVGSNSNAAEHGLDKEENRAAILEVDLLTGRTRLYASGLRNPNGMDFEPETGALWTVVNERDELGSDLVPDYMTSVKEGGFYGWPFSYWGRHVDTRVSPPNPEKVAAAIVPDYALGNHTASLGLAFAKGDLLPDPFRSGVFIGQHGSWNRNPHSGYKVIFVAFEGGRPTGKPIDVLTGFLNQDGEARGRPVGVALDAQGALLVADDVGNKVWRVAPADRTVDRRFPATE